MFLPCCCGLLFFPFLLPNFLCPLFLLADPGAGAERRGSRADGGGQSCGPASGPRGLPLEGRCLLFPSLSLQQCLIWGPVELNSSVSESVSQSVGIVLCCRSGTHSAGRARGAGPVPTGLPALRPGPVPTSGRGHRPQPALRVETGRLRHQPRLRPVRLSAEEHHPCQVRRRNFPRSHGWLVCVSKHWE